MTAEKSLNKTLFHGTGYFFQEGDQITPSTGHVVEGEHTNKALSFATTDIRRARSRAGVKAQQKNMLFAPVYEVVAPEGEDLKTKRGDLVDPSDHISAKGHIVKNIVDWGINKVIQPIDPGYE
jgi:hypothetical protein